MKLPVICTLCAVILAGCATVKVASDGGRTVADAENSSWRIFWWIPLAGGDCDDPNDDFCTWFKFTSTLENNMRLLNYARTRKGARAFRDMQTYVDDDIYLFIFRRTAMHTSAELEYQHPTDYTP